MVMAWAVDSGRMGDRERNDQGRYTEQVSVDDVLRLFDGGEPLTAGEVADAFDISNRAALNKLDELHERGEIERKEVGARAVVWWKD